MPEARVFGKYPAHQEAQTGNNKKIITVSKRPKSHEEPLLLRMLTYDEGNVCTHYYTRHNVVVNIQSPPNLKPSSVISSSLFPLHFPQKDWDIAKIQTPALTQLLALPLSSICRCSCSSATSKSTILLIAISHATAVAINQRLKCILLLMHRPSWYIERLCRPRVRDRSACELRKALCARVLCSCCIGRRVRMEVARWCSHTASWTSVARYLRIGGLVRLSGICTVGSRHIVFGWSQVAVTWNSHESGSTICTRYIILGRPVLFVLSDEIAVRICVLGSRVGETMRGFWTERVLSMIWRDITRDNDCRRV